MPFRVNTYTEDAQRYPSIAMDNQGDFTIAWQSLNQDGSGYGIYAQRYDTGGRPFGGVNESQVLTVHGTPTGSFELLWSKGSPSLVTGPIPINGSTTATIQYGGLTTSVAAAVQAELAKIGAQVQVLAINGTQLLITFIGDDAGQPEPPLVVVNTSFAPASASITEQTTVQGAAGEFRVNDTTANDQKFPAVAMSQQGDFVVTWTSYGTGGDQPYQASIYAKQFSSNQTLAQEGQKSLAQLQSLSYIVPPSSSRLNEKVVSTDDPSNHVVTPPSPYDGVVEIDTNLGGRRVLPGFGLAPRRRAGDRDRRPRRLGRLRQWSRPERDHQFRHAHRPGVHDRDANHCQPRLCSPFGESAERRGGYHIAGGRARRRSSSTPCTPAMAS